MYGYIYMTINLINNRKYIGQKKSDVFLANKYLGSGIILRQAVRAYGKENFQVILIEECDTKEELDEKEKYYIELYDAAHSDEFYNIALGGQSQAHVHSEEEKKRISEAQIGKKLSNETKQRISLSLKEYYLEHPACALSEEQKIKISEKMKDRVVDDEVRIKMSESHKGVPLSDYHKQRISENHADVSGSNNPAYGRMWVNNGIIAKLIKPEDYDVFVENGFVKGVLPRKRKNLTQEFETQDGEVMS